MNLLDIQYSLATKSLDIYLAGCRGPHCTDCHNPGSWSFDQGTPALSEEVLEGITRSVRDFAGLVDNIFVMGGEPLDNPTVILDQFLDELRKHGLPLWLFTHYNLTHVPFSVRVRCDYIKTGRYDEEQLAENIQWGVTLASANQQIWKKGEDY